MSTPGDLIIDGFSDEMEKLGGAKLMAGLFGLAALPTLIPMAKQKALQATLYRGYQDPGHIPGAPRWYQRYGSASRAPRLGFFEKHLMHPLISGQPPQSIIEHPFVTPRRTLHKMKSAIPGGQTAATYYGKKFPGVAKALTPGKVWKPGA